MALLLLGVRLLLAVTFVAAGLLKLRNTRGFSQTLAAFAVPRSLVPLGALVVPLVELIVGLSLVPAASAGGGALASVALLAAFTAATVVSLLHGRTPDCACFGATTAEPIGPATLVRNGTLMAFALFVLIAGPGGELTFLGSAWSTSTSDGRVTGAAAVLFLFALAALNLSASRLRASNARLASRVTTLENRLRAQPSAALAQDLGAGGLPVGATAPTFDLPRLEGDRASLASLTAGGRSAALIFLSAHCPACHELWPDIERWQSGAASRLTIAAVCSGSPQTIELKLMGHNAVNVLLEGESRIAEAYALSLRPSAVIVGPTGIVESGSVAGVAAIRTLVTERIRD